MIIPDRTIFVKGAILAYFSQKTILTYPQFDPFPGLKTGLKNVKI